MSSCWLFLLFLLLFLLIHDNRIYLLIVLILIILSFLSLWFTFDIAHKISRINVDITYCLYQSTNDGNSFKNWFIEFCENYTCLTRINKWRYLSHKWRIVTVLEIFRQDCAGKQFFTCHNKSYSIRCPVDTTEILRLLKLHAKVHSKGHTSSLRRLILL